MKEPADPPSGTSGNTMMGLGAGTGGAVLAKTGTGLFRMDVSGTCHNNTANASGFIELWCGNGNVVAPPAFNDYLPTSGVYQVARSRSTKAPTTDDWRMFHSHGYVNLSALPNGTPIWFDVRCATDQPYQNFAIRDLTITVQEVPPNP